jgi:hypothetical protein
MAWCCIHRVRVMCYDLVPHTKGCMPGDEGGDAERDDDEALMDQVYGVSASYHDLVLQKLV